MFVRFPDLAKLADFPLPLVNTPPTLVTKIWLIYLMLIISLYIDIKIEIE